MQCITAQPQGLRFGQRALMQPATLQPSTAELLEQRNGPIGDAKLLWQNDFTRFVNLEHRQYDEFEQFSKF